MSKRKYRKSGPAHSLDDLYKWLKIGGGVYIRDHYQTPGWVMSLQLHYLAGQMGMGKVFFAIPINKEDEA